MIGISFTSKVRFANVVKMIFDLTLKTRITIKRRIITPYCDSVPGRFIGTIPACVDHRHCPVAAGSGHHVRPHCAAAAGCGGRRRASSMRRRCIDIRSRLAVAVVGVVVAHKLVRCCVADAIVGVAAGVNDTLRALLLLLLPTVVAAPMQLPQPQAVGFYFNEMFVAGVADIALATTASASVRLAPAISPSCFGRNQLFATAGEVLQRRRWMA